MDSKDKNDKIKIQGITNNGQTFRPSDWAHRISESMASFENMRLEYSPLIQPSQDQNGNHCILIDPKLKQENPTLYKSIMDFAKKNNLKICK